MQQQQREQDQQEGNLQRQLREMEQQLREKDQQEENLQRQLDEMEQQLIEEEDEKKNLERQLRITVQQLREEEVEKENLQRQLREMERQLSEKDKQKENLQRHLRGIQKQLKEKCQQEDDLQREMEQHLRGKGEQQRQLRVIQQQMFNLQRKCKEKEQGCSNLERELRDRDQDLVELNKILSDAEKQLKECKCKEKRDWIIPRDEIVIADKRVGEGSWGYVNEGKYCGCTVAVKRLSEIEVISPYNRSKFEREMDIASRCRHPCLLQFIGATNDEGSPLFVTELMESSLRQLLKKRPLADEEVFTISLDVARALSYLHKKKPPILHRDVSSPNVLLWRRDNQWRAKVSDYGTANFLQETMTANPGAMVYSAPEACAQTQTVKVGNS